ncbi:hypothetical protein FALBO_15531 [Fusarium albosuccineum]|uniref:DUF4267 domain-containing protein n=1 Tax=Fusarium albosuccineum TaxID=1237068 RepID=A0A8H4KTK5_9HYPO|nr:hypothetical protein FALBO_15531 [Fusarium albosuccineum]
MNAIAPIYAYVLGTICAGVGLNCIRDPAAEMPRFGRVATRLQGASPLVYVKGRGEFGVGIALLALQYQDNKPAVTTMAAVIALMGISDALIVWFNSGAKMRHKALGHGCFGVIFAAWAIARAGLF